MTFCRVLSSVAEIHAAQRECERLTLCAAPDSRKHWDNLIAVNAIRARGIGVDEPIADLGCRSGIMLTWLHQLGFRRLYGCDLRAPYPPLKAAIMQQQWRTALWGSRMYLRHRGRLRRTPVERTGFPGATFAAVTCMSVIEHGVDIGAFFQETARLLRPGGVLILSTDYWPDGIDVGELKRFAKARDYDRIFNRGEIHELCRIAAANGLSRVGDPALDAGGPVIVSERFRYTFLTLAFQRDERATSVA